MDTTELLKKVRRIEIKTRGLSRNIFAGQYHSAFMGRGMAFSEVREYQFGDDVRDIDWNVTARQQRPYIKVFEEEREMTVMLLVDVSASRNFGAVGELKKEMITEIAATLAFSTIQNNDKIGVIFFSDRIEKFIPPQKREKTCPLHHTRIDRFYTRTYGNRAFTGIALSYQRHKKTVYGIFYLRFHYARRFFQRHDHRQPQARCRRHTGI